MPESLLREVKKEAFNSATGFSAESEAGGDDFGVVQDQAVAGGKILDEVTKMAVFESFAIAVQNHESRIGSPAQRMLSDQRFRQVKIEFGCFHSGEVIRPTVSGTRFFWIMIVKMCRRGGRERSDKFDARVKSHFSCYKTPLTKRKPRYSELMTLASSFSKSYASYAENKNRDSVGIGWSEPLYDDQDGNR